MAQILDFGDPFGVPPPKREETCPGPICTIIMQNLTPLGITVPDCYHIQKNTKQTIYQTNRILALRLSDNKLINVTKRGIIKTG